MKKMKILILLLFNSLPYSLIRIKFLFTINIIFIFISSTIFVDANQGILGINLGVVLGGSPNNNNRQNQRQNHRPNHTLLQPHQQQLHQQQPHQTHSRTTTSTTRKPTTTTTLKPLVPSIPPEEDVENLPQSSLSPSDWRNIERLKYQWENTQHIRSKAAEMFIFSLNPRERYSSHGACFSPSSELGRCHFIQHCPLKEVVQDFDAFLDYLCFIKNRFVGICCPDSYWESSLDAEEEYEDKPMRQKDKPVYSISSIYSSTEKAKPEHVTPRSTQQTSHSRPQSVTSPKPVPTTSNTTVKPKPTAATTSITKPKHAAATTKNTTTTTKPKPTAITSTQTSTTKPQAVTTAKPAYDPLDYNGICGVSENPKIVGGAIAEPNEWIWMAALLLKSNVYCGGTLISSKHILTAAHCLRNLLPKDITVRLGGYDFSTSASPDAQDFEVENFKLHPKYNRFTNEYDLAILTLKGAATFTQNLKPICLPQANRDYAEQLAVVTGWGREETSGKTSKILRQVSLPVWNNTACNHQYSQKITEVFLCAGYRDGGKDSCQGDSGGPLMLQGPNYRWIIIGVVSWGIKCAQANYPGVYTRVSVFNDWIKENIKH